MKKFEINDAMTVNIDEQALIQPTLCDGCVYTIHDEPKKVVEVKLIGFHCECFPYKTVIRYLWEIHCGKSCGKQWITFNTKKELEEIDNKENQ